MCQADGYPCAYWPLLRVIFTSHGKEKVRVCAAADNSCSSSGCVLFNLVKWHAD